MTPRTCTLASVPVARMGIAAMTTTSGLTRATPPSRATWAASSTMRTSSILMKLPISEVEPALWTMAFSGRPEETRVAWKPRARASMAMKTPTVPAIPRTATTEDIQRSFALRML